MGRIDDLFKLFKIKALDDNLYKQNSTGGGVGPGKTRGAFVFALNFLCILSFFQEKESMKAQLYNVEFYFASIRWIFLIHSF